jgi:HSP20 family molecular chaperone IbpA
MSLIKLRDNDIFGIDRLFDDVLSTWKTPLWSDPLASDSNIVNYRDPIDMKTYEDGSFKYSFDVPGFSKNDIDIELDEDNMLLNIKSKSIEKSENESRQRHVSYRISLPEQTDIKGLEATCQDGILSIHGRTIPKQEAKNVKKIKIK